MAEDHTTRMIESKVAVGAAREEERISVATQWQLMWWRFRKHKVANIAAIVLITYYVVVLFADFFAYADPNLPAAERGLLPPQPIHLFDDDGWNPHVLAFEGSRDPETFKRVYKILGDQQISVQFFAQGLEYEILGIIPWDRHLIGVSDDAGGALAQEHVSLLGTDIQGRDMWSRIIFATRISMTIGLIAVAISQILGIVIGGVSGYFGGLIDTVIQRIIEIVRSIPQIPLLMGIAAAVPKDWSIEQIYFAITILLALILWTELARVVRGRFLSLREEDFVMAAELAGASRMRIILRHMVPSFLSHIIAATTLAIPTIIISETSLSFLGLGLRPPAISWGVLLQQAQNIQTLALSPWLLLPALPVIVAILAFNFLGDGLRDAADPYGT